MDNFSTIDLVGSITEPNGAAIWLSVVECHPAGMSQIRGSPPAHMGEISGVPLAIATKCQV